MFRAPPSQYYSSGKLEYTARFFAPPRSGRRRIYTSSQITRPRLPAVMSRQITKALASRETDQARLPRPLAFKKMYTFVQ